MAIKLYRKKSPLSYTLGAYPTMELLLHAPESLQTIYTHPKIDAPLRDLLRETAAPAGADVVESAEIEKLTEKANIFVAATFRKSFASLRVDLPHLVLVNPSNYGNLGTMLRSALGWDYLDIALIEPAADPFHPNCIRASMGAHFRLRLSLFEDFEDYRNQFPGRALYSLMTRKSAQLEETDRFPEAHSLILGNESTGLPDEFADKTQPLTIATSDAIDSLNITLAAAIAMHHVYTKKKPIRG